MSCLYLYAQSMRAEAYQQSHLNDCLMKGTEYRMKFTPRGLAKRATNQQHPSISKSAQKKTHSSTLSTLNEFDSSQ